MREKQQFIKEKLDQYKEYHKGLGIMEFIQVTKEFIENQTEEFEEIDKEGNLKEKANEIKKPNQIGKIGKKNDEI